MSKADKKKQAAARARALLGLDDDADTSAGDRVSQLPEVLPRASGLLEAGRGRAGKPDVGHKRAASDSSRAPVPSKDVQQPDQPSERPAVPLVSGIDPKFYPKKHEPGALKAGDSVWYRGERFYIEYVPAEWSKGCYARICDRPVRPGLPSPSTQALHRNGLNIHGKSVKSEGSTLSFCVHPDMLSLAPVARNAYAPQPTLAGVARKERAARGEKDVGDEVAVMLRGGKTLDDVYRIGAEYLQVSESDLRTKYGHLNPGQQRMNIGNRMRAKWRKEQR